MNNITYAFILTSIAGASTLIGLLPIFFKVKNENKLISMSCSFASGIIISISMFDLMPESIHYIRERFSFIPTIIIVITSIFIGIILSMILDHYVEEKSSNNSLYKVGLLSMIAIILHNIPEGIVTFIVSSKDISLGIPLTLAIAMHNIPEGISIGIPIYYSQKSSSKAFWYTFISAISEPFGALITYLFLKNIITNTSLGILFAIIAGIMLQISTCKLLPTSLNYNYKKSSVISFTVGFIFMFIILFFN